jgi:hypothetical protein
MLHVFGGVANRARAAILETNLKERERFGILPRRLNNTLGRPIYFT